MIRNTASTATSATNAIWSTTLATGSLISATVVGGGGRTRIPRVHNKYHNTAPPGAVSIMRGTPWGNPFPIGNGATRELVIARFEREILPNLDLTPLIGKHLICCCKPKDCHGDPIMDKLRVLERARNQFHG